MAETTFGFHSSSAENVSTIRKFRPAAGGCFLEVVIQCQSTKREGWSGVGGSFGNNFITRQAAKTLFLDMFVHNA